jgi:hypothetical protein
MYRKGDDLNRWRGLATTEETHMTEPPSDPEVPATREPEPPTTGAPRWVKVFGVIALALVVVFLIVHLAGGGFSNHTAPAGH